MWKFSYKLTTLMVNFLAVYFVTEKNWRASSLSWNIVAALLWLYIILSERKSK
jgi:cytochrome c oxidase assembly factor CtaG